MSIFDTFETNQKAEVDGVWKDFPKNKDGTVPQFLIARMAATNTEYQKALEECARNFKLEIQLDVFTDEQAFEPLLDVFVKHILKGWRNIQKKDGTDIPYSHDNAKDLMRKLPDLYTVLREQATKITTFRNAAIQEQAGN